MYGEAAFVDNNEKVLDYTGLPSWKVLLALLTYVCPKIASMSQSMSAFQLLIMILMRLRLKLSGQDLGYRFALHKSSVSRLFSQMIDVMCSVLKPLIYWPDRDVLRQTLPMDFRKHCPNCTVIIDCSRFLLKGQQTC